MTTSNNTDSVLSTVTVYLKDHLGQPIRNLKVEIRGLDAQAHRLFHAASTNAHGAVQFSVSRGQNLAVHVQRWASDSMKEVARVNASLEQIRFHLTSPKTLHELSTKVDDAGRGEYWRGTYKVKPHDNLTVIARKYHTSVDLLRHINHLRSDLVRVGQSLKVPPVQLRKSDSPAQRKPAPRGTPPQNEHHNNGRGAPVTTPRQGVAPVIFPIRMRPLNDEGAIYGRSDCNYTWNAQLGAPGRQQARFGAHRNQGSRKHAGRDLYVEAHTEVLAIANGVVIKCEPFYCQTHQISIHHTTADGREFIGLYGEVDAASIRVNVGDRVNQGDVIARSGILMKAGNVPVQVIGNQNVSMLHFEAYSGAAGFDRHSKLNGGGLPGPFYRRSDLIDSLALLQEGYRATFLDALPLQPIGGRIAVEQLKTSERGKEFIRSWEGVKYDANRKNTYYYDDSKGYCTVGWGHLIATQSCASLGYTARVSMISVEEALTYFEKDVSKHENYVRQAISAPLYQHEFDALVSLAFNVGHISKVAPRFCGKLNDCNYADAPCEFDDMENRARRKSERQVFCTGVYDSSH
jgi:GH24 family phage-related lysozyme (muramidase)/LysM repeat protein/5-hydroxyisourate hydrolase-like protein (transthyretin family)